MLLARFDGGCWPNPHGHAACACLIERNGEEVYRNSKYLGEGQHTTNNVAEFEGILMILRWFNKHVKENGAEMITIIGDSRIVINRLSRAKNLDHTSKGVCEEVSRDCLLSASWHRPLITFKWQPRTRNEECDAMCTELIDDARFVRPGTCALAAKGAK